MKERFLTRSAVILMLMRDTEKGEEVLLQKRKNTGYIDGFYDLYDSGHVEKDEPMTSALIREAKEEIGIVIKLEDIELATMMHTKTPETGQIYYNGFFKVKQYKEEIKINEPEKCEELRWFPLDKLPENLLQDRLQAIKNEKENLKYSEFGWENFI